MRRDVPASGGLWQVGWRTLLRHPLQTLLMVLGIWEDVTVWIQSRLTSSFETVI